VIAAGSDTAALAPTAATATIPIVFAGGNDPVRLGLVASLNRPGDNVTGVVNLNIELGPKRLELLHELVPSAKVIGLLVNPTNPSAEIISSELQAAARRLGLEPQTKYASPRAEREIDMAVADLLSLRAGALVIGADVFLTTRSKELAILTMRHALPAISQSREFADSGGLISYGPHFLDVYRQTGSYTGRILKGEKPADLPVVQPTKFELVINLTIARALGITIPNTLLALADEVIE
jgi:putative ABC transport system substrate-binding protein